MARKTLEKLLVEKLFLHMKKLTQKDIISLKTNLLGAPFNFRVTLLLVLAFAVNCHFFPCASWKENVDLYIYTFCYVIILRISFVVEYST